MPLNDPGFLFLFLPFVLVGYFLVPCSWRNGLLLVVSLYFYAVGEGIYLGILLGICAWNYFLARVIDSHLLGDRKLALIVGILGNLSILFFFKYLLAFKLALKGYAPPISHLPAILDNDYIFLGLSFAILQAISYLVDVYCQLIKAENNGIDLALYFCFFAKVSAGPIARYGEMASAIKQRSPNLAKFTGGIKRFVLGFGKVMILGSGVAPLAQGVFTIPGEHLTFGLAWLGAIAYSLWIYHNFSGYTDMAIGLGKLFSLPLPENFDYPYTARSVTDFWWRWHRTLALWFQDYLYHPLGGDRVSRWRRSLNWLIVGIMVGIWHGARVNFLLWGLYYGSFLAFEARYSKFQEQMPRWSQQVYLWLAISIGWVIFRTDSLLAAWLYLKAMIGFGQGDGILYHLGLYFNAYIALMLGLGLLGCLPIYPWLRAKLTSIRKQVGQNCYLMLKVGEFVYLGAIFWSSVALFPNNLYTYFLYSHF
jgi:alginate O-acetyltransferase complex protein AlgI